MAAVGPWVRALWTLILKLNLPGLIISGFGEKAFIEKNLHHIGTANQSSDSHRLIHQIATCPQVLEGVHDLDRDLHSFPHSNAPSLPFHVCAQGLP